MRHFRRMPNWGTSRALLSATWEIEPRYGLQYLAEAEQFDPGTTRSKEIFVISENARTDVDGFSGDFTEGSIAHLVLSGVMLLEDGLCSRGIRSLNADLAAADANPNISGIILEINSGGGQNTAGTELQNAIKDIVDRGQTPVVVYAQALASAALRAAVAANYIVAASSTTDVGSVGTMLQVDAKKIDELRESTVFYARQSTMKNKGVRALLEGNEGPLLDYVSERAQGFIDSVEQMRPGMRRNQEQFDRLQSGDLFTGSEAAQIGLIDAVGTFASAVQYLSKRKKTKSTYSAPTGPVERQNTIAMSKESGAWVRLFNSIFKKDLPETATAQEAQEAIEDDQQPQVVEDGTIVEDIVLSDQIQALTDQVAALTTTVEQQAEIIAGLNDTNTDLAAKQTELETQLNDAKLGKPAPVDNGRVADRSQFATVTNHEKKFGAKYE